MRFQKRIMHFYLEGARFTVDEYDSGKIEYIKCIKTPTGMPGASLEEENLITQQELIDAVSGSLCNTIAKNRFTVPLDREWEVDDFISAGDTRMKLVIAEVEWIFPEGQVDMEEVNSYRVPDEMSPYVIAEVTGDRRFSNFSMSRSNG